MKKIITIILAISIVSCIFVSCSKSETENNTENNFKVSYVYDSSNTFDESSVRAYQNVCEAIINGDATVAYNVSFLDDVNMMLNTNFPLISLVSSIDYDNKNSCFKITYKNDEKTHKTLVSEFNKQVETILEKCGYNNNPNKILYVANVYKYFAQNSTLSYDSVTTIYDTIMYGEGMPSTISTAFEYILLQSGYKCIHLTGTKDNGEFTAWSAVELNGNYYYFDVASEMNSKTKGNGLIYFGETTKERINDGINEPFILTNDANAPTCDNEFFNDLRTCYSWEGDNQTIKASTKDGKITKIDISNS